MPLKQQQLVLIPPCLQFGGSHFLHSSAHGSAAYRCLRFPFQQHRQCSQLLLAPRPVKTAALRQRPLVQE